MGRDSNIFSLLLFLLFFFFFPPTSYASERLVLPPSLLAVAEQRALTQAGLMQGRATSRGEEGQTAPGGAPAEAGGPAVGWRNRTLVALTLQNPTGKNGQGGHTKPPGMPVPPASHPAPSSA